MPGPLRLDRTPYLSARGGLFEAFEDPHIETIFLCFGAQTAKTTGMLVCLLYGIDQDPGSTLWAMPSESLCRSFSKTRVQTIIEDSPRLKALKPNNPDMFQTLEMHFRQMTLTLSGGNSPAGLSSRPVRRFLADEIDKFPIETKREGSLLKLGIRRTTHFWDRKIILSSTPTLADGQVWQGLLSGDWRQYWVPCPRCGEMQRLTFHNIRKPEGLKDPNEIRISSWYECAFCAGRIEEDEKLEMIRAGEWKPRPDPEPEYDWTPPPPGGRVVSMHLPSWYAMWVRFGDVLARFIQAQPYPEILREVVNSDFAEPWEERGEHYKEAQVLEHRSSYVVGMFPSNAPVAAVVQTVDVQADSLYYTVRGWGAPGEESWLTRYGIIPDFPALASMLRDEYSGYRLNMILIDARYRTGEVYEFCRQHGGCIPIMGVENQFQPLRWSVIDRMPGTGAPIVGGLRLLTIRSSQFREWLFHRLAIRRGDPGYWHLPEEAGEDYARQITAEILVERRDATGRRTQKWKQIRPDNHYLDCEVYQLAGASALGIRYLPAGTEQEKPQAAAAPEKTKAEDQKGRPDPWSPTRFKI